jgi:hypothetical protein
MSEDVAEERLSLERDRRATQLKRSGQWRLLIGGLLCLTVIGAIIGIPLAYTGWKKLREAKRVKAGDTAVS